MVSGDNDVKQGSWCNWVQSNGATEECGRYDSPSGATGTVSTTVQVSNAAGTMVNLVQLVQSVQWCN